MANALAATLLLALSVSAAAAPLTPAKTTVETRAAGVKAEPGETLGGSFCTGTTLVNWYLPSGRHEVAQLDSLRCGGTSETLGGTFCTGTTLVNWYSPSGRQAVGQLNAPQCGGVTETVGGSFCTGTTLVNWYTPGGRQAVAAFNAYQCGGPGITLVAGQVSRADPDGTGAAARFSSPRGVAVDALGNTYVADTGLHIIRKIDPAGKVVTMAGVPGANGTTDGTGAQARFDGPTSIAIDPPGNLYVTDTNNYTVRKISPSGVVTTLAGSAGKRGTADGLGTAAQFGLPESIAVDRNGNVFVGDAPNGYAYGFPGAGTYAGTVRKIAPSGLVVTLALPTNSFSAPLSLAVDAQSNLIIGDWINHNLRKIAPDGSISTVFTFESTSTKTDVQRLNAIAVDAAGAIYVSNGASSAQFTATVRFDYIGNTILKVSPSGSLTTLAGTTGTSGWKDGGLGVAQFWAPRGLALDTQGNLIVADSGNNAVRKVSATGVVSTLAGPNPIFATVDGNSTDSRFTGIYDMLLGPTGQLLVLDKSKLRSITSGGEVSTLTLQDATMGLGSYGAALDGKGILYTGLDYALRYYITTAAIPGANPSDAKYYPWNGSNIFDMVMDPSGNLFVASWGGVTKITPAGVSVLLGASYFSANAGSSINKMVVDASGALYISTWDHVILKLSSNNTVSVVAGGLGAAGFSDGSGAAARFNSPHGMVVDAQGNLYVADSGNNAIRKVSLAGVVTTVAGNSGTADTVVGALPGGLWSPNRLVLDNDGSLLVSVAGPGIVRVRLP